MSYDPENKANFGDEEFENTLQWFLDFLSPNDSEFLAKSGREERFVECKRVHKR